MKTKIMSMVATVAAFTAFAGGDNYLYWMVDLQPSEASEYAFCYATVKQDGTLLENKTTGGTYVGKEVDIVGEATSGTKTPSVYAYNFGDYIGSTFLFELYNDADDLVGSKTVSGSSLTSYIGSTMAQISPSAPYVVMNVVPEPTSGLLMLLGLAGLALKRKRA